MAGSDTEDEKRSASKAKPMKKFTQKTPEYKKLEKLFAQGKITPCDKPGDIRTGYPCFQAFTSSQFRSQFNKLKIVFGTNTKEGYKRFATAKPDEDEDEEEDEDDLDPEPLAGYTIDPTVAANMYGRQARATAEKLNQLLDWTPKKIVKEWINDGIRNLTIIFALTGGAVDRNSDGIECKVTSDGSQFAISEKWSALMSDMTAYYEPVTREHDETPDEFTRRRFNMEDQVKILLQASGTGDTLVSVYRMPLPFPVDPTSLKVRFHGAKDGSRFCHVDLTEKKKLINQAVTFLDAGRKAKTGSAEKPKYSSLGH